MKISNHYLKLLLGAVLFLALAATALPAQYGKLILNVSEIEPEEGGEISAGIFTESNFPEVGKATYSKNLKVTNATQMQVVFERVPVGSYGVAVYQDEDLDGDLNSNWVGYPTEPLGFSRDARVRFGPPDFKDAEIQIRPNSTTTLNIKLR